MVRTAKQPGSRCAAACSASSAADSKGAIDPATVLDLVKRHLDLEIDELALADSTGMADPRHPISWARCSSSPANPVILHLHDTEGEGLANALAAIQAGVRYFDTAFGGMGGCPFIKGATGNIATEDLVAMVERMGMTTGVDIRAVAEISRSRWRSSSAGVSRASMHRVLGNDEIKVVL